MLLLIIVIVFTVPALLTLILLVNVSQYRVDLRPGQTPFEGASTYWLLNVWRESNYSERGIRLLRWFRRALILLCVAVFVDLVLLAIAYT